MSRIFYKGVRCDGTDFYSGTVDYAAALVSGDPVRAPRVKDARICGPGMLHAATLPAETLVGGEWPCRLFEVTGRPVAGMDDAHPYKAGFKTLRVAREIDAYLALGPNGAEVAALIERAGRLTLDECRRLTAARYAARDAAREAAQGAAWDAAGVAAWYAARGAAQDAAQGAAQEAAESTAGGAVGGAVALTARNAARALVVRDLIPVEHFDALYGPWASVMEAGR